MLILYICKVLLLIVSAIRGLLSIECFNCSNVFNVSECNTTVTCNDAQVCYKSHGKTDQIMYDFGCADKLNCAESSSQPQNVSEPFQADSCFECCSENNCNKHLCEKLSVCKDKSAECALLNSTITICENAKEAKKICKKYCNLCHIVDGKWSKWSEWAKCDVTCGNGSRMRHRECDSPAPNHGGLECPGDGRDKKPCFAHLCPAHGGWSQWDVWGECSATCGVGMRSRKRSCTNPRPHRFGDHCFGNSIEDELCNKGFCAVDGGWTEWNQWGKCPAPCGEGLQSRSRSCTNPSPANAGKQCVGQNSDVKLCYRQFCDEDCYAIKKRRGKQQSGKYNVLQYRFNGSIDFYRNFSDYEKGFGSVDGEFWLGLENIYEMVSRGKTELRMDLTAADGTSAYETFQNFKLGERPYYTLHIDKGVGTAGDTLGLSYHNGRNFSTFDMGHTSHCAISDHGGWWYGGCAHANLNGEYVTPGTRRPVNREGGMIYRSFKDTESLKVSKMMFRRV